MNLPRRSGVRSATRKVATLVMFGAIGAVVMPSAYAQHEAGEHARDRGYGHEGRGEGRQEGRRYEHDRGEHRGREDYRSRAYSYAQPVYVPRPVYREPRPSPGISIFLPLDLRR
jgi:hypothetical protein